jgi:hypothetical protein
MKNKKTKIIFALLFGVALIFFIFLKNDYHFQRQYLFNVLGCTLFDKNVIFVEGENIDVNKITIELIEESQGVIFKNGKKTKKMKNEYGGNTFEIFYDSLLIAQAWIYHTCWHYTHKYFFNIIKKDSTFDFNFKVEGPNSESLGYKMCTTDKQNKTFTEVFYDTKGKTGQINIDYYDDKGNVIVGETWENDTLTNMNLYKNGDWYKNYGTNNSWKTTVYKLIKEPHNDSLKYIYQTIEDGKIEDEEVIKIKL